MATPEPNTIVPAAASLAATCLGTWAGKTPGGTDDQYWEGGQWVAGLPLPAPKPSYRQGGPAVAAAVVRRYERDQPPANGLNPYMRPIAEQTVDWALSADGRAQIGWCGTGPVDAIETMMFMQDLGVVILLLDGDTAPAKIDTWKAALREGADRLLLDVDWYANGNINLGYALAIYLAWRVTGDAKYDWRTVLQKTKTPAPHSGGTGYGLVVESDPTSWVFNFDGSAFFTEQKAAGWPVGYDGEYTMVQLDVLTRLALLTGDPEIRLLTSQVLNKTLERTNLATWTVDCGKGTRHTADAWDRLLTSPALHVLNSQGRKIPFEVRQSHWSRVEQEFRSDPILKRPNVVFYRGLGSWVGLVVLNDLVSRGVVPQVA